MTDPVDTDGLRDMGAALTKDGHLFGSHITAAADEVDRLRTVIENAPHTGMCPWWVDHNYCMCWKADAA